MSPHDLNRTIFSNKNYPTQLDFFVFIYRVLNNYQFITHSVFCRYFAFRIVSDVVNIVLTDSECIYRVD
jgi:hypothetical protein